MTREIQSVVAIMYGNEEFLILKKKRTWTGWQFMQGSIDDGEDAETALKREIEEETGLTDIEIVKKLPLKYDYWFVKEGEKIHKFLTFFLVKANKKEKIKLSIEHSEYKWCRYEEVLKDLKYNKDLFEEAYKELKK